MDLQKERESLVAQRDNALSVYHQTIGAISLIDILLAEQNVVMEMSEAELKEQLVA